MPEGDTIYRTARTLSQALGGKIILKSSIHGLSGVTVTQVESKGKNLLIHLSSGSVLHSHLRMKGSWHIYRPGETWWKPRSRARAVLEVEDFVAVCFDAPVVRMLEEAALKTDDRIARLGPDLLASSGVDLAEIRKRLREHPELEIAVAVMRQGSLAGIGNVYKSEILFLEKVSPFLRVVELDDSDLDRLVRRATSLMKQNLEGGVRRTRAGPAERVWAYGRRGKACFRCGSRINMARQGEARRLTYYCPACQKKPGMPPDDSDTGR